MKKLESTFKNMIISLTIISVVVAGLLAFVYTMTKEPIVQAEKTKQEQAVRDVMPEFDNNPIAEKIKVAIGDGDSLTIFPAKQDGNLIGFAIASNTYKGFSGEIKIMVGLDKDGNILDYSILEHKETPGLGTKMVDWFKPVLKKEKSLVEKIFGFEIKATERKSSVIGKNLGHEQLIVSKAAKAENEIDAITGATITTRAFLDALQRAYTAYLEIEKSDSDTHESAGKPNQEENE